MEILLKSIVFFGKKTELVKNTAQQNDIVLLLGNSTGKDGIGGSQFASLSLDSSEDRSAIQIPDPFVKKLLIEVIFIQHLLREI